MLERGWELGFLLAGLLFHPKVTLSRPSGSERVLVVAPHPDDETLGCGGTIAQHLEAGDQVCVLVVTDGGGSRAGGLGRDEIRRLRATETARAARSLGPVDLVQLGLPEGRWAPGDLLEHLVALLRSHAPQLVYAPSCIDFHPEHVKVARVLADALRSLEGSVRPKIRIYELQVPLTPILANIAVEVGGAAAKKKARALSDYRTQQGSLGHVPRQSRYLRRLYRSRHPLEVFWELDPESYCRLMECGSTTAKYRGMRLRPLSDGLAWSAGAEERRRMKQLALGRTRS
jgi:LmbE family N-acetylglucosaminyl deacetylase